jgi:hypothetical protein
LWTLKKLQHSNDTPSQMVERDAAED